MFRWHALCMYFWHGRREVVCTRRMMHCSGMGRVARAVAAAARGSRRRSCGICWAASRSWARMLPASSAPPACHPRGTACRRRCALPHPLLHPAPERALHACTLRVRKGF